MILDNDWWLWSGILWLDVGGKLDMTLVLHATYSLNEASICKFCHMNNTRPISRCTPNMATDVRTTTVTTNHQIHHIVCWKLLIIHKPAIKHQPPISHQWNPTNHTKPSTNEPPYEPPMKQPQANHRPTAELLPTRDPATPGSVPLELGGQSAAAAAQRLPRRPATALRSSNLQRSAAEALRVGLTQQVVTTHRSQSGTGEMRESHHPVEFHGCGSVHP